MHGRTNFAWAKIREKLVLKMFLDYEDLIHYEFIPEGQTVNKKLFSIFKALTRHHQDPEKWEGNNWTLLNYYAPVKWPQLV